MDESYLTGEPFKMPKAPGSQVFSGAITTETAGAVILDTSLKRVRRTVSPCPPHATHCAPECDGRDSVMLAHVLAWCLAGSAVQYTAEIANTRSSRSLYAIRSRNRAFGGSCAVCEVRGIRSRSSVLPDRGDRDCLVLRVVRGDERLDSDSPLGVSRDVVVRNCGRRRIQVEHVDRRRGAGRPWRL